MKKVFRIVLAFVFILAFATSCGSTEGEKKPEATEGKAITEAVTQDSSTENKSSELITEEKTETKTEAKTEIKTEERTEGETMKEAATLLYQGHASIRISTPEGKTIYVDPFMGEGYDVPADLILMTHGHYDHTQTKLIKNKNAECVTISWVDAISGGQHQSFDLGYVKVEAVEAGYNQNHDVSNCVGYILTFSNGATVYLSGDTSTTPQMKELADRNLDYAFICCDGVYNMDVTEASQCARLVGAKHNIPYHMVPSDNSNGFDLSVAESFDVPGRIILEPGEELILND